ncbi:MAG: hypothetical protein Q8N05_13585 [Bacteroidota bacterium]|nr:hypothetical protein [Bacteroidota bacterium]
MPTSQHVVLIYKLLLSQMYSGLVLFVFSTCLNSISEGVSFKLILPLVERQTSGEKQVTERTVPAKAFGEFLCAIFDEWKAFDIGKIKIQIIEEALRTAFDLEHTLCIFKKTCGGVPVVEHNGDFYSCGHFVDSEHLLGNIRNNSLVDLLERP